jgi:hypothetical protein
MASISTRTLLAGCVCCVALIACAKQNQDEMGWARAALERNQHVEIVAADPQSRTFTVRNKDTGELRIVRADQLAAAPESAAAATPTPAAAASPPAAASPTPAAASVGAEAPAAPPAAAAETSPNEAAAAQAAAPANDSGAAAPEAAPAPKVFASKALQGGSATPPVPGQVLEAGPGYTIEAGSAPTSGGAGREPAAGSAAIEYRHEPIVCQGARLLHIDNRNLQFEGDAVSAEDGCEIHITNSRIRATGIGVSARAANVHIDNSLIEGDAASIDASNGAQIYTAASRFRGLSRQLDTAAVHDLGGNVWN